MSRPRGRAANGAALTFAEISKRTGQPISTTYAAYRRAEEKFVLFYLIRFKFADSRHKELAAA